MYPFAHLYDFTFDWGTGDGDTVCSPILLWLRFAVTLPPVSWARPTQLEIMEVIIWS